MPSLRPLLLLLLVAIATTQVSATFSRYPKINWGCGNSKAPQWERDDCSGPGSFFTFIQNKGKAVCCSEKTKIPPRDLDCPLSWYMHKKESCCIPPKEITECDCGEGYTWNAQQNKCTKNTSGACRGNEWFHGRSKSCCPSNPQPNKGNCPKGKTCPKDWYWCKLTKKCRPETPRSPEPDCDNWNDNTQCCESPTSPSQKPATPPKGQYWKRSDLLAERVQADIKLRSEQEQSVFEQEELNAMYCPKRLTACSINSTLTGGDVSWAFECIDTESELESCGGCVTNGQGVDCTALPGVRSVTCTEGRCEAYKCDTGFKLIGTACVPV